MKFRFNNKARPTRRVRRVVLATMGILVIIIVAGGLVVRQAYYDNLQARSTAPAAIVVTIVPGSTNAQIARLLQEKGVIRSDWAFVWYLRTHKGLDHLKAGTYLLSSDQDVSRIVTVLITGQIATELVTVLPGKRLDQIRAGLIKDGFTAEAVDQALDPARYQDHPALRDKPPEANLEGYLYPDSFQKIAETTPGDIIKLSLDQMDRYLTPDIRAKFTSQGLTVHQGVMLASLVEQEVGNPDDRPQVAQVFLKRKAIGMQLGSDVTAFYGAILAGQPPSVSYDSPYNTRLHDGLPPGPISNVSANSLQAVATPAATDWLFFVAGDDGKTYFSMTNEEHEELVRTHCTKLCQ